MDNMDCLPTPVYKVRDNKVISVDIRGRLLLSQPREPSIAYETQERRVRLESAQRHTLGDVNSNDGCPNCFSRQDFGSADAENTEAMCISYHLHGTLVLVEGSRRRLCVAGRGLSEPKAVSKRPFSEVSDSGDEDLHEAKKRKTGVE